MAAGTAAARRRRRVTPGRVVAGILSGGASEIFRAVSKIGEKRPVEVAAATLVPPVKRARAPLGVRGIKGGIRATSSGGITDVLQIDGLVTDEELEALKGFVEDELEKDQRVLDSLARLARVNASDVQEVQESLATLADTLTQLQAAAEEMEAPEVVRAAAAAPGGLFGGGGIGMIMILLLLTGGLGGTTTTTGLGGLDPIVLILLLGGLGGGGGLFGGGDGGGLGGLLPLILIMTIL